MPGKRVSKAKKSAAAAMRGLGVPVRTVAKELGISRATAHLAGRDPTLDPEVVKACQEQIGGRMAVAADRFLTHALDKIKDLGPYQATLCAGITHDHYLRNRMLASRAGAGSVLVQILVAIDQSVRSTEPDPSLPTSLSLSSETKLCQACGAIPPCGCKG